MSAWVILQNLSVSSHNYQQIVNPEHFVWGWKLSKFNINFLFFMQRHSFCLLLSLSIISFNKKIVFLYNYGSTQTYTRLNKKKTIYRSTSVEYFVLNMYTKLMLLTKQKIYWLIITKHRGKNIISFKKGSFRSFSGQKANSSI